MIKFWGKKTEIRHFGKDLEEIRRFGKDLGKIERFDENKTIRVQPIRSKKDEDSNFVKDGNHLGSPTSHEEPIQQTGLIIRLKETLFRQMT